MRKIEWLKLALKTGAFWEMFKSPPAPNSTPNHREVEKKTNELWAKYRNLVWKYEDNDLRLLALYKAHRRDLIRLINKQKMH
jgi:hypothetical protein